MLKKLIAVCLLNFLIAALLGVALRYSFIGDLGLNYRFLTHTHSHVAMLGWVYLMLFAFIVHYFIPNKKPVFTRLFWLTEIAVIGMLLSFPFQGYAAVSISFSTLHILCSYYFVYLVWKHHKTASKVTGLLLKTALVFMIVSTFGVWCLGPAVSMQGKASAFYQIAIQFFLHFQFNGWFLIAALAIFFHLINITYSKVFKQFYGLLIASTVLTLALPIHWFLPHGVLFFINVIGISLQVVMLYKLFLLVKRNKHFITDNSSKFTKLLLGFTWVCFTCKVLFQIVSVLPEFAQTLYTHRNFVVGFIHLLMLGVITGLLFVFILKNRLVTLSKTLGLGLYSFLIGFCVTELLLLIQGACFYFSKGLMPNYYVLLFIFSVFMPMGILLLLTNLIKSKLQN